MVFWAAIIALFIVFVVLCWQLYHSPSQSQRERQNLNQALLELKYQIGLILIPPIQQFLDEINERFPNE